MDDKFEVQPETAPLVIVYPRNQLTAVDASRLAAAGIICIEADDPKSVVQLQLSAQLLTMPISGDDFVKAAINALATLPASTARVTTYMDVARSNFVAALAETLNGAKP